MKRLIHNLIVSFLVLVKKRGNEPRLRKWIQLESQKEKIIKAAEDKDKNFPVELLAYLSASFGISYKWFQYADWVKLISAFYFCITHSPQIKLPITHPTNERHKDEPWDYPERTWYLYSHMIAKSYGWPLEYISQLKVQDALAIIQEILVDEQLEHEFYYGLSEVAYPYNASTKKSEFKPLTRPSWMRPQAEPEKIKKILIPRSLMPVGVVDYSNALPEDFLPKEQETE